MKIFDKAHYLIFLGIFFYFLIYIINGENSIIKIEDNLDSEILYRLLPKESGTLFSISNDAVVPQIMNGLKRNSLNASAFNFITLLFALFPPFWAYLINFIIAKSIAFTGMYLILSKYLFKEINDYPKLLASILAAGFTLLYAYTIYGIAVLGLPLLIYCIFNILNGKRGFFNYFFIGIFPFYSSLVLGGYAIVGAIFMVSIYYFFKKKNKPGKILLVISVSMGLLYLIAEINLLNQFFFDKDFVSHRTAWDPAFDQAGWSYAGLSISDALTRAYKFFLYGYFDAPLNAKIIVAFFVILIIIFPKKLIQERNTITLMIVLIILSSIYGFYYLNSQLVIGLKENVFLFKIFRFDRVIFFETLAWYFLAAYLIKFAISLKNKWVYLITLIFLVSNPYFSIRGNKELKANLSSLIHYGKINMPSYKEFYAEELFDEIKTDIDEPLDLFRTISIGLYPAIAQYNGFYTLDSYQNNYPLDYKLAFRKIIKNELEKSDWNKWLFDSWGSQCYVFAAELGRNVYITEDVEINNLDLNTDAFYNLGGRYILSAAKINNYSENNLQFLKVYSKEEIPIKVYLYDVIKRE